MRDLKGNEYQTAKIKGVDKNGKCYWYTGKAGHEFISINESDAFLGYSLQGAQRRALNLNAMNDMHGMRFVAVNPETKKN